MPVAFALPAIASVVSIAGGIRSMRQSGNASSNAADAAAAADPFAQYRDLFSGELVSRYKDLINFDPNKLREDPAYQFEQEEGMNAINNAASAGGLLRSGNRLLDLSKFSSGLAAKYNQQNFQNRMGVANFLAQLGGAFSGSPAAAGQAIQNGFANEQSLVNNGINSITGGLSTFASIFNKPGGGGGYGAPGTVGVGTPGGYGGDY